MRNWKPFIKDALAELARGRRDARDRHPDGAAVLDARACRSTSTRRRRRCPAGMQFERGRVVPRPPAAARRVRRARPRARSRSPTSRSSSRRTALPVRVIEAGDRYADEVAATARGVAERAGIAEVRRAYQSAGRTPEPWIGPDLAKVIDDRVGATSASSWSCRSASSATTPRSSSTSTSRRRRSPASSRRRCGAPSRSTPRRPSSRCWKIWSNATRPGLGS